MSRVWTAAEVERVSGEGISEIVLMPGDLISPSGRDVAENRGLAIRRGTAGAPADRRDDDGAAGTAPPPVGASAPAESADQLVGDELVTRIRELAGAIAANRPNASAAEVARETLSALGANGSPGIGTPESAQPLPGHRMPTKAKGARPQYHTDPGLDAVISTVTTLASEVWVLSERIRTLEALLVDKKVIASGAVDAHYATGADAEARMNAARRFVARVLRVFAEWREGIVADETPGVYHEVIRRAFQQSKGHK